MTWKFWAHMLLLALLITITACHRPIPSWMGGCYRGDFKCSQDGK